MSRRGAIERPPALAVDRDKQIEALENQVKSLVQVVNELKGQPTEPKSKPTFLMLADLPPQRFPRDIISDRIEEALERHGIPVKQLAAPLDITPSALWKKLAELNPFTIAEADLLGRLFPDAPSLWPFVDWDEGLAIDEFRKTWKR